MLSKMDLKTKVYIQIYNKLSFNVKLQQLQLYLIQKTKKIKQDQMGTF